MVLKTYVKRACSRPCEDQSLPDPFPCRNELCFLWIGHGQNSQPCTASEASEKFKLLSSQKLRLHWHLPCFYFVCACQVMSLNTVIVCYQSKVETSLNSIIDHWLALPSQEPEYSYRCQSVFFFYLVRFSMEKNTRFPSHVSQNTVGDGRYFLSSICIDPSLSVNLLPLRCSVEPQYPDCSGN